MSCMADALCSACEPAWAVIKSFKKSFKMQCQALLLTVYFYFTLLCFYNTAMFTQFMLTADTAVSRDFSRMGLSLIGALLISISYRGLLGENVG